MTASYIRLDSRALAFLRAELQASPVLGAYLQHVDFEAGTMAALVPSPLRGSVYDFRSSIYDYPSDSIQDGLQCVVSVDDAIFVIMKGYFDSFPNALLLTESFMLRSEDLSIASGLPDSTFVHQSAVFFAASADSSDDEAWSVARRLFQAPFALGVLATLPSPLVVGEDVVEMAAHRVDAVLLGAYDGEGLLIWSRRTLPEHVFAPPLAERHHPGPR